MYLILCLTILFATQSSFASTNNPQSATNSHTILEANPLTETIQIDGQLEAAWFEAAHFERTR